MSPCWLIMLRSQGLVPVVPIQTFGSPIPEGFCPKTGNCTYTQIQWEHDFSEVKCHSLGPPVPRLWPRVDLCSDWGTFGKICAKSRTKHREWLPPSLVEQWGIGASSYGNLHGQWQPLDLWGTLFLDNANTRIIHKLERFTGFEVVPSIINSI